VVNRITLPITGTGTMKEKRKHDGTTPSSSPKKIEISLPDHRKQRHHSNELEIDPPNSTVPIEINFGMYTNDIDMGNMDHTTTLMRRGEDNNNDTEMGQVEETNNNASQRIGYVGSSGSFCSRNTNSDGTTTVIKEEQSITGHNFGSAVDVMDYTTRTAPRTIRTTTQSNNGFTVVQNGSPNRSSIRERRESRVNNNPYSVLQSTSIKKKTNSNIPSAKDRHGPKND
jgi:hypothetical protein